MQNDSVFIRFLGLPYAEYAKHFIEIYSIRYIGESVKIHDDDLYGFLIRF